MDSKNKVEDQGKEWPQIMAILISCMTSFTFGALYVWPSPSIVKIVHDHENYNISENEASYFATIPSIGMVLFSVLFLNLCDIIGRKYTLMLIAVPHIIAWTLIAFAKSVYVFYVSRLISGLADAAVFAALPMYIGEVATPKVRGSWGNAFSVSIYIAQFFINVAGSYLSVQITAFIFLTVPISFAILMFFMPETPYYYLIKGQDENARNALKFLRRKEDVEEELLSIKDAIARQMSEDHSWMALVKLISNRRALYCGLFLRISQQMSGTSAFFTYNQLLFSKSGGSLSASMSSIIFFLLIFGLTIPACFTLDMFGRKKTYLYSMIVCALCVYVECVYFFIDENVPEWNTDNFQWLPLAGLLAFCVAYAFGIGIVPTLMMSELYSASIKGKALCILNIGFGLSIIITTQIFHLLSTYVGLYCPFLFFGIICTISCVLSHYFVPETKGKTLEEIQHILRGGKSVS